LQAAGEFPGDPVRSTQELGGDAERIAGGVTQESAAGTGGERRGW